MPIRHTVQSGECLTTIAFRHGFKDHHAIYDHGDNAELKENRPNPNVLASGDVWVIPDIEPRELDLAVDKSHKVKVHRPKKELRIAFKSPAGEALASEAYTFEIAGGEPKDGTTDGDGMLKELVPIGTTRATLTIQGRELQLQLGALEPVKATRDDGATGVRARLGNLGYPSGGSGVPRAAIAVFQHDRQATIDGQISDDLRDTLSDDHGS